ncbi:MAG: thioredoxin domain-containing protein [Defluviicoccus sp.]
MSSNLLAAETSPYLLQHKDNPVHWQPWGEAALKMAHEHDKPILLSVGYAACHWCHVMAHESFERAETARLMNDLFVNIKVDREERPDVDSIYQTALALLGEQGGWPLTMFLTPDGRPFWGGTYFPPEPRYGRPAFADILRQVAHVYHTDKDKVGKNVEALSEAMARMAKPEPGQGLSRPLVDEVAAGALRMVDPLTGGTPGAPKFPQPVFFRFLWRSAMRTGAPMLKLAVTLTLDEMAQGGIYDHLAGGFARYSTDTHWLVPHFEKMLYDNALLVDLLTEVWQTTKSPLYAQRVRETIAWVLADLRVEHPDDGTVAFASAFDADSEGVEGKYYVWSRAEIEAVLGDAADTFCHTYDVRRGGNWEGMTILNRTASARAGLPVDEAALARARERLLAVRRKRVPPGRDDKVLADWNGMMITGLTHAAVAFDEPAWLAAAQQAFAFVSRHMLLDGRLRHTWCAGQARHPAVIEDYAALSTAALALYEATGTAEYLAAARTWVAVADRHYWDAAGDGYHQTADDTLDVINRPKLVADHAVPSGNGAMVDVLARLYLLTGEDAYRARAERLVRLFSSDKIQYLLSIPGLLTGWETLERALQVVVLGVKDDPAAIALAQAAAAQPLAAVTRLPPGAELPLGHPAHGKTTLDGQPTAYVCQGGTCSLPLTDASALHNALVTG